MYQCPKCLVCLKAPVFLQKHIEYCTATLPPPKKEEISEECKNQLKAEILSELRQQLKEEIKAEIKSILQNTKSS
jgi:hypothetical protein